MELALTQFSVSFAYVFLRGFQTQNVIGGKYLPAFIVCYMMAALEILTVTLIVKAGWASFLPVGTGSALGIVTSMYFYKRFNK